MNKRLVTDDEILELGTIGGDWSFGEVEALLESEHNKTATNIIQIVFDWRTMDSIEFFKKYPEYPVDKYHFY